MASATYIRELLQRYKDGHCTPEEIARLEQWFEQVQGEQDTSSLLTDADEERLVLRLQQNPRFKAPAAVVQARTGRGLFRRLPATAAAVWLGLLLASTVATWLIYRNHRPAAAQQKLTFVEIKTAAGERRQVVLPDSSVVWLNGRSRLAYHPQFAAHRELRLTGEAFFEVTHDKNHPFTVQAGDAFTKVYGTAFNIAAYSGAGELRVALQQGSIGITCDSTKHNGETVLAPGQLFIYDNNTKAVQVTAEQVEDIGGWVSGKLVFNQVPLKDVLVQLERRYNVVYSYPAALKNPRVTARFENASLQKIMEHLSFGWDIHFKQKGDTLYVQ